jgi:hypothetical protein
MAEKRNFSTSQINKIKKLRTEGKSANFIAKELGRRKQDVLSQIRQIENKPINTQKITRITNTEPLDFPTTQFIEALYKSGYPEAFISKLVKAKHPENSNYRIKKYLKQYKADNPDSIDSHKTNMRFFKATNKWKQHLDAKYYRETNQHFYKDSKDRFREGSPTIEIEDEEIEAENEVL